MGCGHDLVTKSDSQRMTQFIRQASPPMSFNTANGVAHVDQVLKVGVGDFASTANPSLLGRTPS
eukprot:4403732-Lingulodinium_polyedra.AAC.1